MSLMIQRRAASGVVCPLNPILQLHSVGAENTSGGILTSAFPL